MSRIQTHIAFQWPSFTITNEWSLFLDRDGVINRRQPNDYIKTWDEFEFLPNVLDSMGILQQYFGRIFIVTNQAGIEKGIMTHESVQTIHDKMVECIIYYGGRVDEIYYCPYADWSEPLCRKPNPGMALEAKRDFPDVDFKKSVMVGDSDSDIAFGNRLGMKTILVGNKSENTFTMADSVPDSRLDSLHDVALYFAENPRITVNR